MLLQTSRSSRRGRLRNTCRDFADQAVSIIRPTPPNTRTKTHAEYYGRRRPAHRASASGGCATLSQALRLAASNREEIAASTRRVAQRPERVWRQTVLALNTEVRSVVSLTHPTSPVDTATSRIQSWRLNKDWSIDIAARTVTPSMYDLTVGRTVGRTPAPLPVLFYPTPLGRRGRRIRVQAAANDSLFPGEWTFDTTSLTRKMADGSMPRTWCDRKCR